MIRSTRRALAAALSATALLLTGCSSTPTDSAPVVIAHAKPDPTTPTTPVTPHAVPPVQAQVPSTPRTTVPGSTEAPVPVPAVTAAAAATSDLRSEDLLFLSYITEFTLMGKPASDQVRLGLSMCNALFRGQAKPDVTAEFLRDGRYTAAEIANILTAATIAYCPTVA